MKIYKITGIGTAYMPDGSHQVEGVELLSQSLNEKVKYVFGRDRDYANVLIEHGSISKKHASITLDGGYLTIKDEQSANGTWVDGQRIDCLKIGIEKGFPEIYFGMVWINLEQEELVIEKNESLKDKFKRKTTPRQLHFTEFHDEKKKEGAVQKFFGLFK